MLSTAISSSLATLTFPIRHQFTQVNPEVDGRDSDLNNMGDANTHVLVTGLAARLLSTHDRNHDYSNLIGKVVPVRPSRPTSSEWFLSSDDNDGFGVYVTGARVSREPVNGRVYQELRTSGGSATSSPFYLRYNDEAHRADRARDSNPWTIVWAQEGLEHQIGHARVEAPQAWVELQWPLVAVGAETPVATGLATDEDIDAILSDVDATAAAVLHTGNATTDHTHGRAHVETEGEHAGHVLLNPARVPGEMYLTWYEDHYWYSDHVAVQVASGEDLFTPVGYFNRGMDGQVYFTEDIYSNAPVPRFTGTDNPIRWAKLAFEVSEPDDVEARRAALIEQATASHEAFENLNDALNELAREQSWCSEYERTMQFIGMRDRRSGPRRPFDLADVGSVAPIERHAWDVDYDVEVTVTDESPSYRVSERLESEYGTSSVSNIRFDAMLTVTIRGVVAATADAAEEMVSRSQIEDEVESMIDGEVEMSDYTHSDTNEDHDFDWDEYDENN